MNQKAYLSNECLHYTLQARFLRQLQIGRPVRTLKAVKAKVPRVPICTRLEIIAPGNRLLGSPEEYPSE